jgi:cellulose synthase/poly-beta-1,6-N-acetylglucosamine synthase-like glycosyltransferase
MNMSEARAAEQASAGGEAVSPMVSVVIACRNAESTLGVQLAALSAQRCAVSWDVIISDNGSTDGTVALARSYKSRLPGLTIVDSSQRPGAGYARNVGAAATQAPLLLFCDADDEVAPGWLAAMVNAAKRNDFVAGRFESKKLNDAATLRSRPLQQDVSLQESPFGPGLPHAGAGNMAVNRALFLSVGGFDPEVGCLEDTDLSWRIQLTGATLVFCPEAIVHVRLRSSLSTMWAQGMAYGEASALLTKRFPRPAVAVSAITAPAEHQSNPVRTAIGLLQDNRNPGALLWAVGWHVGHRKGMASRAPVAPVPVASRAPRAS